MSHLNESDWQSFIYLVVLLVFLASGLVARQNLDWKKIFKYFGIWAVIGFFIIVLYSYRFEFSDFKNRILGEVNPSLARSNKDGQIVINISRDNHFYVNTLINDKKVRFMIDTGASDIVINLRDAKRVGIDVDNLLFNKRYQTANGISYGANTRLEKFQFGDIIFNDVPASVNSAEMGTSLLGMRFLRQFKKYEFYQDKLILTI